MCRHVSKVPYGSYAPGCHTVGRITLFKGYWLVKAVFEVHYARGAVTFLVT
jgi:hypothetical protein